MTLVAGRGSARRAWRFSVRSFGCWIHCLRVYFSLSGFSVLSTPFFVVDTNVAQGRMSNEILTRK